MARPSVPGRGGGGRRGRPASRPGHGLHHPGDDPADQPSRRNPRAGRGETGADARRERPSRSSAWRLPCRSPSSTPTSGPRACPRDSIANSRTAWRARPWRRTTRTTGSTALARDSTDSRPWPRPRTRRRGDSLAQAKLEAVIRVREQLGSRSSALVMYQGYPFDRLRHRLGLVLAHPDSVDPLDLSCASLAELQQLNPEELDDRAASRSLQVRRRVSATTP